MNVVLVLAIFAATPPDPALPPLKLATGNFTYVGIKPELRAFVPEHLATRLRDAGVTVVTQAQMEALIGRERQRALMGCDDGGESCLAELSGALGADGVLMGELAAVGELIQLNLKIVSEAGKVLASWSERVDGERHLLDALDAGSIAIADQVLLATGRKHPPVAQPGSARSLWWVPAAGGGAVGLAGSVMLGLALRDHQRLTTPGSPMLEDQPARWLAREGNNLQILGFAGIGVGVAAIAASAALYFFRSPPAVTPSVSVNASGAAFALGGSFP